MLMGHVLGVLTLLSVHIVCVLVHTVLCKASLEISETTFYCTTIAYHAELNAISGARRNPANIQEK